MPSCWRCYRAFQSIDGWRSTVSLSANAHISESDMGHSILVSNLDVSHPSIRAYLRMMGWNIFVVDFN